MPIYTIHLPPDSGSRFAHAERALVVPDTFSWLAFLFGPLWLLANGLWLALFAWVVIAVGIDFGLRALHASQAVLALVLLCIGLFIGFEGRQLFRAKWERRGFRPWDVVAARNTSEAEHVFFTRWLTGDEPPARPKPVTPVPKAPEQNEVIGLFPMAEGGR